MLIAAAMFALAFAGALALAVDFGRMYVIKSLVQARADAAALAAAVQLDGTAAGVASAAAAARRMAAQPAGVEVEFAAVREGPWTPAAGASLQSRFARVRIKAQTALFFMRILDSGAAGSVGAAAAAGQLESQALTRTPEASACSAATLGARLEQDSDRSSRTYAEYAAAGLGNGRRIALCADGGEAGALFAALDGSAEPIGSFVLGSRRRGVADSGAYVVRLVD